MRSFIALVFTFAACSGDVPRPATPISNTNTTTAIATGDVRIQFGRDDPYFNYPVTVAYPGGHTEIPDGTEHRITVPAGDHELTRIDVGSSEHVWVRVPVGGAVLLTADACCGITFDSNTYDDAIATCADTDGDCGAEALPVPHALAHDPVCGHHTRCVPDNLLSIEQRRAGGPTELQDETERIYRASEGEMLTSPNATDMFWFAVEGSPDWHEIAMDRGVAYTVVLDGEWVTRIRATRW
jgi:hypothetical protein